MRGARNVEQRFSVRMTVLGARWVAAPLLILALLATVCSGSRQSLRTTPTPHIPASRHIIFALRGSRAILVLVFVCAHNADVRQGSKF
jgi:hypothetical protein